MHRNAYSVNSHLIGEQAEARLKVEIVEVWYAGRKVEELPRLCGRNKHRVDHRHIIDWLLRKPGAFENYRYREERFPTNRFRMVWDALREVAPVEANKRYLEILQLAAQEGSVHYMPPVNRMINGKLGTRPSSNKHAPKNKFNL